MRLYLNKPLPKFTGEVAIDIETSGLDPYIDKLLSIAISDGTDVWILLDFYGFDGVKELLEDDSVIKIAHNAKFEYKWFLHTLGCRMALLFDTQLAEDTIYKGLDRSNYPTSLEWTLNRRKGILVDKSVREEFYNHPGFAVRPVTVKQLEYMKDDVIHLHDIKKQQIVEGTDKGLIPTFNLENDCVPVTAELEYYGKKMDVDLWFSQVSEMEQLVTKYDKRARDVIGTDTIVVSYTKGDKIFTADTINFNSNQQVLNLYNTVFGDNIKSTNAKLVLIPKLEMGQLTKRGSKFTEELLKMREWRDRKKFAYERFIHPVTGKSHCEYRQDGTATGRYSSKDPNMQQVPRPTSPDEPNLRHIWVADDENHVIIRCDYSQQEPRILGQILGLKDVIKACNTTDVYISLGSIIFKRQISKKDEERQLCKIALLGKSYGQKLEAFCKTINKPLEEGLRIYNLVESSFPVDAFANNMRKQAAQYGFVTTLNGRRRNFDYTKKVPYNEPLNTPVQGTAADMFKLALVKIHKELTKMKKCGKIEDSTRVWHIVHDEIEVHCHKDEVDIVLPLVKQLMEEAGSEICPDVKHIAEAEYGYRWDK